MGALSRPAGHGALQPHRGANRLGLPGGRRPAVSAYPDQRLAGQRAQGRAGQEAAGGRSAPPGDATRRQLRSARASLLGGSRLEVARRLPRHGRARSVRPGVRQRGVAAGAGRDERRGSLSVRSEEHTSELQSQSNLVCRLLLEKKKNKWNDEFEKKLSD